MAITFAIKGDNHVDAAVPPKKPGTPLEVVYTGNTQTVASLFISLIEVDEAEGLGPRKRSAPKGERPKGDLIAEFECKIDKGVLSLVNTTPKTPTLPKDAPVVKVTLAGTDFDLKLPGVDQENSLFEIRVVAETKQNSKRPEFVSEWVGFARHFAFPRPPGIKGAVVAFVTGAEDGTFFSAAKDFWKLHADAVFDQDGLSLEEIVEFLKDRAPDFGGYGEVNIVTHGNRISALIKLTKDGPRELRIARMDEAFKNPKVAAKFKAAGDMGLTSDSRVVFRACNIGHRPDLLKEIREKVFNDAAPVFAPKFLQAYEGGSSPSEFFVEDLNFFVPGSSQLPADKEEARVKKLFEQAHPSLDFKAEKDTYDIKKRDVRSDEFPMELHEELFIDFSTGKRRTDEQIGQKSAAEFNNLSAQGDARDFTNFKQWKAGARRNEKRKSLNPPDDAAWVEPQGSGHSPAAAHVPSGEQLLVGASSDLALSKDADTDGGGMMLKGKDIEDNHLEIGYAGNKVTFDGLPTASGSKATFTFNKKTVSSGSATLPASIEVGGVTLQMRRRDLIQFDVPITRFQTSWRRTLRIDGAKKYKERTKVVPDVKNKDHFGSSDDPSPSRAELEKLSE